jgi:hypothetical protein
MTTIFIGDKKRPFKFGILAASVFCKETGKGINELNDISDADINSIINVLFAGLFQGAKMAGHDIDFDFYKVAEWMDDIDQNEITKAFESMAESNAPSKKKAKK